MGKLIDGQLIADKINQKTAKITAKLKARQIPVKLAVILVGADKPSQTYVRKKGQSAIKVGIDFALYKLPADITQQALIKKILAVQKDPKLTGLIVQLPLPEHLYTDEVLNSIQPKIDVDCLTNYNLGRLVMKTNELAPPTPSAVLAILEELKINLVGKNVVIVGLGALVGKPLAIMMINQRASLTTCNSATVDMKQKCRQADIIISGVGKKNLIRGQMIKPGAIVIDTGVCFVKNKMYGDVNVKEVLAKAKYLTPTPGGVGPITVAKLLYNTALRAKSIHKQNI
ncbi:MAG: bifunctional 5,10-methylene-tetrahydrofolate dehydrogenase/5,10-methylene-tetrahydrofolate cyclohydrolase [Candidatus Magasanikbacteria bacterium CG10_big_fil_rev_8_21_14_0_10_40_10]|uniref:Bifunctional protein FolD n=1 Tax=Candidatus Magasanikbacteria bacterium CG10_big_fil_rev_8_21_14_0_10_40_10 TaxID=1974648 RepID=A0A2M6W3Q0_9BACT|nr:MAG: bifunctional 5,10-methylene-tetrahydrofolate dehydrogenase/5,10-methylene-tetrahydrofolate cyclohydrolase [Candidatus Magasanikbacteria bacterium CG10_big_fil_rev_8_21_14_0_10_40_10]